MTQVLRKWQHRRERGAKHTAATHVLGRRALYAHQDLKLQTLYWWREIADRRVAAFAALQRVQRALVLQRMRMLLVSWASEVVLCTRARGALLRVLQHAFNTQQVRLQQWVLNDWAYGLQHLRLLRLERMLAYTHVLRQRLKTVALSLQEAFRGWLRCHVISSSYVARDSLFVAVSARKIQVCAYTCVCVCVCACVCVCVCVCGCV